MAIKNTFTEQCNMERAVSVLHMSKQELKETFWDKEDFDVAEEKLGWGVYLTGVKKHMKQVVRAGGEGIERTYRYGKLEGGGRLYVEGGGVQNLQGNMRNYICGQYYYDFDISNCHPCILLHICNQFGLDASCLKQYVENRQDTLSSSDLTKRDILIAINQDKNQNKRDNQFYNSFVFELERNKAQIIKKIEHLGIKTANEKNPLSSIVNKYILRFEGDILQTAIQYFGTSAEVPMFDGVMVNKNFCTPEELDTHLETLNGLFADTYQGLIVFKNKSTDSSVELKEVAVKIVEYDHLKPEFEKSHFITVKPFAYWKKNKEPDGSFSFNQIKENDFKNACEEYQIISFNSRDELTPTSIFKRWMADPTKRKYESIDFLPYGNDDTCPKHVYNTFQGFEVNKIVNHERVCVANFGELIFNLCNEDATTSEYLMKYVAHMFQHPNKRTEKIIVLKGWTGTGKDTLFRTLRYLMGTKHVGITESPESLFGNFNDIMDSKLGLFMNELEGADGIKYQEKLKAAACNIKNLINVKYEKPVEQNNFCRIFVNSNNDGCVNIKSDDRRYVVINTGFKLVTNVKDGEEKAKAVAFWQKYYNNLNDPNWRRSLYDFLMSMDLTGFNVKNDPVTAEKAIMREKNISPLHIYLQKMIADGKYYGFSEKAIKGESLHLIRWKDFTTKYKLWMEEHYTPEYKIKDTSIKQKLMNMNNSFTPDRQIIHMVDGQKKKEKFACFDMAKANSFLQDFVFTDKEDEGVDVGELHENALPKKKFVISDRL